MPIDGVKTLPVLTVAEAIAHLSRLPPDAEMRVVEVLGDAGDGGIEVDSPAVDLDYTEMGPLKYVHLLTAYGLKERGR